MAKKREKYVMSDDYQWREESLRMIMLHSCVHRSHEHYKSYLDEYTLDGRLLDYFSNHLGLDSKVIQMISLYSVGYKYLRICDTIVRTNDIRNDAELRDASDFLRIVFNGESNVLLAGIYTRKEIEKLSKLTGVKISKVMLDDFEKTSKNYLASGKKLRESEDFIKDFLENEKEYMTQLEKDGENEENK